MTQSSITIKRAASLTGCLVLIATMFPLNLLAASRSVLSDATSFAVRPRAYRAFPVRLEVPTGTFADVTLELGVRMRGHNGLIIHAHFTVKNRVNMRCVLFAYFYDVNNDPVPSVENRALPARVTRNLNPQYPSTEYKDLQIFVPTTTFHALPKGSYVLRVRLLILSDNKQIGRSEQSPDFTLIL